MEILFSVFSENSYSFPALKLASLNVTISLTTARYMHGHTNILALVLYQDSSEIFMNFLTLCNVICKHRFFVFFFIPSRTDHQQAFNGGTQVVYIRERCVHADCPTYNMQLFPMILHGVESNLTLIY